MAAVHYAMPGTLTQLNMRGLYSNRRSLVSVEALRRGSPPSAEVKVNSANSSSWRGA